MSTLYTAPPIWAWLFPVRRKTHDIRSIRRTLDKSSKNRYCNCDLYSGKHGIICLELLPSMFPGESSMEKINITSLFSRYKVCSFSNRCCNSTISSLVTVGYQWTMFIIIIPNNAHRLQGYCCQSSCSAPFYMTCTSFDRRDLHIYKRNAILATCRTNNTRVSTVYARIEASPE